MRGESWGGNEKPEGVREVEERRGEAEKSRVDKSRFTPPTLTESIDYFISKGSNNFEGDKFFNFYESKNWYVGKSKMKSWNSAANGWISRNSKQGEDIRTISDNSDWHLQDKGF